MVGEAHFCGLDSSVLKQEYVFDENPKIAVSHCPQTQECHIVGVFVSILEQEDQGSQMEVFIHPCV